MNNSHMRLLLCVLDDSSIWCRTSTTRDFETITRRVENEGWSFITITLPTFCSDFERSLADGRIDRNSFMGFKRMKNSSLPAFLSGLMSIVFDSVSGCLLDNPDIHAIACIRQICLLHKKVLLPCSKEREKQAFEGFVKCEHEVSIANRKVATLDDSIKIPLGVFGEVSDVMWSSVLGDLSNKVASHDLIPRHGPGATAEKISGNQKYSIKRWHERLQPFFPADLFAIPSYNALEMLEDIDFIEPDAELPVRVIQVPKTLKTPRIIAIEPVCMQYAQQALMAPMVSVLESHPLTGGKINFTDQTVNRELALSSSKSGRFATLDLKEASDRVPASLVDRMLKTVPALREAIFACRSTRARVPGIGDQHLTKFASMGSALCFPIESMVFYTICISAELQRLGLRVSRTNLLRVSRDVRVYGDDIIVPVEAVPLVCSELEAFGLKVNFRKSFDSGKFRESCGMDAYDGTPVTPAYCRRTLPSNKRNALEIVSALSLSNQLYERGFWIAAQYLRDIVTGLNVPVPIVADTSPIIGRKSFVFDYEYSRVCPILHRRLARGIRIRTVKRTSVIDGYAALMKCFLKQGDEPFADKDHLERYGRPLSVDIKTGWFPVH